MVVTPLRRFWRRESGVSAVELALILPVVLTALIFMAEIGFLLHQRMTMSHILRVGAESAIRGDDADRIAAAVEAAARDHATPRMAALTVDAPQQLCFCPNAEPVPVACNTDCADGTRPDMYYHFSASLPYRSLLLGDRLDVVLGSQLRVQVPSGAP